MSKSTTYIYWVSTILLCLLMSYSAGMYFTNTAMVEGFFTSFSYPSYLVIPLAVAKILGILTILIRPVRWLTEWAYAGFFFDLLLAAAAHYLAGDGAWLLPLLGMLALFLSHITGHRVRPFYDDNLL